LRYRPSFEGGEFVAEVGALIAVGRTSSVYAYCSGSVIKVPHPDVPNEWASQEAIYCDLARRLDVPVPECRGLVTLHGRDAIIFERIDGPSMWQE
jgi:predicted Ser/Thr protein kinase